VNGKRADGLLLLDKPTGPTSHDFVTSVKRLMGANRVGHCGTLDPLASGLLVVLVGDATRLAPYVHGDPKVYEGSIVLGISTDSMDMEGEVTRESAYTHGVEAARDALASLQGELEQVPPMYSAVKYRGRPLYRYARAGEEVPRRARKVRVYSVEMLAFREMDDRAELDFNVACSPGTYVRDLAARVGEILGCGGTLSRLRRKASGPFPLQEATGLEELALGLEQGESALLPMESALRGRRRIEVEEGAVETVRNGSSVDSMMLLRSEAGIKEGEVVAVCGGGELLGVHRVSSATPFMSRAVRMLPKR
jgi:tRNA pseudouridine55 synthase